MEESHLVTTLQQIILSRIKSNKLELPTMPTIAARCVSMLREPDFSIKKVIALLQQDPVLASTVLRIATSAAYGSAGGLTTLEAAVTRIGSDQLRSLLTQASARQLFRSKDKRIQSACESFWEHSVGVALLARDLAAMAEGNIDSEAAYLAGLLHDVGKPIVASMMLEVERITTQERREKWVDVTVWVNVVNQIHRTVGIALVEAWTVPKEITDAIRDCSDYDSANRSSIANYVRFANAIAKREGIYLGSFEAVDNDSLIMIGRSLLNIDDEILTKVTAGLANRIQTAV